MIINMSLFLAILGITKTESDNTGTALDKIKILLQEYLPLPLINLYRIYTYNLSLAVNKQPWSILKNLLNTTQKIFHKRQTILFYPDFPYRKATIYQICLLLGYKITNNPKKQFDLVINWQRYQTFFTEEAILSEFSQQQNCTVVNLNCQDVSKSFINQIFYEAFGYSIAVDPLTYTGKCVVKSNLNAQHDGQIISCPMEQIETSESEVVYQKFIDNELEECTVIDYRVPIFKQVIPFVYVYIKHNKTETQRFFGYPSLISVQAIETSTVFNQDEINKILSFCQKLGLDYGELDILRDNIDQQIYIVDANNTPSSRLLFEPLQLPLEKCILEAGDRKIALEKMATAFQKEFLNIES